MSAAAERSHAARSSSPISRWRSPSTIVALVWRFVAPASRPHRCSHYLSSWSSSRSPPNGGGGRYHEQASCVLLAACPIRPPSPRPARATRPRRRNRVRRRQRESPQLELAWRGDDEQLPSIGARRVLPRRGDAHRAHARRLGRDPVSSRARTAADFSQLRDHIERRLARAPRYRQKLAPVPLGLHSPEWVDDPAFSVDRHVYRAPGPFDDLADEVMSMPLRRDRPLWEMWICEDRERQQIGLVGKAHHCMVDGIAAVELACLLLDPTPEPPACSER